MRFNRLSLGANVARIFLLSSLFYIISSLFIYSFIPTSQGLAFAMLGQLRMSPSYADLRWVTALSECSINLDDLAKGQLVGCDPWGRGGLNYPPFSVDVARLLHVQGVHTGLLGFTFGIATVCILLAMFKRLFPDDFFAALVLISFPLQLALERCNIDVVVFILLISVVALSVSSRLITLPFITLASFLTVAIKLYPFAGIVTWLALSISRKPRFDSFRASNLLGGVLGLVTVLPWFLNYGDSAPQPPAGPITHSIFVPIPGASYISQIFQIFNLPLALQSVVINVVSFAVPALIFTGVLILCIRRRIPLLWTSDLSSIHGVYPRLLLHSFPKLLGCVWLSCYFLSGSFDYRMIFLLPLFICILALLVNLPSDTQSQLNNFFCLIAASGFIYFFCPFLFLAVQHISKEFLLPHLVIVTYFISFLANSLFLPIVAACATSLLLAFPEKKSVLPHSL